ncbi:hypothetical protein BC834DRAFT_879984 [Gloeopeniophorella convolvens]|nr:hypothetical protein BC834DRAFT_879984 [Gloeopeniophorella convolvens]
MTLAARVLCTSVASLQAYEGPPSLLQWQEFSWMCAQRFPRDIICGPSSLRSPAHWRALPSPCPWEWLTARNLAKSAVLFLASCPSRLPLCTIWLLRRPVSSDVFEGGFFSLVLTRMHHRWHRRPGDFHRCA